MTSKRQEMRQVPPVRYAEHDTQSKWKIHGKPEGLPYLALYLYDQHNRIWKKWPLVPTYIDLAYDLEGKQVVVKIFGFPMANFMAKYTEGLDVDHTSALSLAA
jgi:hypothetical protein